MLYVEKDEGYESASIGILGMTVVAVLIALAGSFLPGLPRGAAFGHEFGLAGMPMPLRLPLTRPVYLSRGESFEVDYHAIVRLGRLSVKVTYAESPFGLVIKPAQETILSVSNSASGVVRYTALRDGYYLFVPSTDVISSISQQCEDKLLEFWRAVRAENSACPKFNISYRMTYFIGPGK